uniref:Uncharacterized protein n=1 Tax=Anguilla anguilla TaxID=7936 RepID=A0A0E9TIM9_ANGAN
MILQWLNIRAWQYYHLTKVSLCYWLVTHYSMLLG